jgi:CubicO group peptidase (beta-lactamase class C family)
MSARLQAALEAQVAAGAPGALARIEAPRADLMWDGAAGYLARDNSRALRPDDAFRAASATKSVTAAVAVRLACQGRLGLDEPLAGQLAAELLHRWSALDALPRTTPRQLLAHTSGLPNYFTDEAFAARLRAEPGRAWRPAELAYRTRPRTVRRAFLPAGALSTATPATWSPGSWWSRRPGSRCTRCTAAGLLATIAASHSAVAGFVTGGVVGAAALVALMWFQFSAWVHAHQQRLFEDEQGRPDAG